MAGTRHPQLRGHRGRKLTNLTVLWELALTPGTHTGGWGESAGQRVFVLGVPAMMSGRVIGLLVSLRSHSSTVPCFRRSAGSLTKLTVLGRVTHTVEIPSLECDTPYDTP